MNHIIGRRSPELRFVKSGVFAAEAQQLLMTALFGNLSRLQNDYLVGILDG